MSTNSVFPFVYDADQYVLYKDVTNGLVYAFRMEHEKYIQGNFTDSNEDLSYTTFSGFLFYFDTESKVNRIDFTNPIMVSAGRLAPFQ